MNRSRAIIGVIVIGMLAALGLIINNAVSGSNNKIKPKAAVAGSGCIFSNGATPAFCDTFDAPAGTGNRSGDLNGDIWGTSRSTGNQNFSSPANGWSTSSLDPCSEGQTAPPHDVQICNGQLHDSTNDGGSVTTLAMYPKQPFDFAGRTGSVVFDVSNDSQGNHAAWPEFWMSDQPVPTPFAHESTFQSNPRNGFGIRFAGCSTTCPRGSNTVGVDSAIIVNNYVENDSFSGGSLRVTTLDSVTKSGPGQMNHYEIQVSQNQIDVYATDAFTPGSTVPQLRHIATIANAGLTFTRGLTWMEDAHYNANKFNTQGDHTFVWDNFGFDGPVLPQDRTFDVLDHASPNLGYFISANSSVSLSTVNIDSTSLANATGAVLLFNHYLQTDPVTFNFSINGHNYTQPWPYPYNKGYSPQTLAVPINLADVQTGVNIVKFTTGSYAMTIFNVDIGLLGGGGLPGGTTTTIAPTTTTQAPTTTIAPTTTTQAPTTTIQPTTTTIPPTTTTSGPITINITNQPCSTVVNGVTENGTCTGTFTFTPGP